MKLSGRFVTGLVAVIFLQFILVGLGRAQDQWKPNLSTMDPEDIRPGMKGYGLTVLKGINPERFDVEIKGVLFDYQGGEDMIVIEIDHPELNNHGAVAGMSGSPIFIDDKLIGALAYGWGFSLKPICGVTPIRQMLNVYGTVTTESRANPSEVGALPGEWPPRQQFSDDDPLRRESIDLPPGTLSRFGIDESPASGASIALRPLAMPLLIGTQSPRTMQYAAEVFRAPGLQPVMAGGQGNAPPTNTPAGPLKLENGSAFSVILVDGDLQISGLGTATYIDGDRFVGFGHPMFGFGAVDMPLARSEVVTIIPSLMMPFKLGNAVERGGALRQDRLWAVGGSLTATSAMTPMHVVVDAPETGSVRDARFTLWPDRRFMPQLVAMCVIDSADSVARLDGPMSLAIDYEIALKGGRTIRRSEFISGEMALPMVAGMQMARTVDTISSNRFQPVAFQSIEARVRIGSRTQAMILDRISREKAAIIRGEALDLEIEYAQWRDEPRRLKIQVPIPANLREGAYEVHVLDGSSRERLELQLRPELAEIDSLDDVLRNLEYSFPSNCLHVVLLEPTDKLVLRGQAQPNLPASVAASTTATVRDAKALGTARGRIISEQRIPFDSMVVGSLTLPIAVKEK